MNVKNMDLYEHKYYVLAPVLANGMAFIGLRDKVATMASKVFKKVMVTRNTLSVKGRYIPFKEFAVIGRKPQKSENYNISLENFSLIHEVSYDSDIIRAAIQKGSKALISELRTDDFFPIGSCSKIIAEKVTGLFDGDTDPVSEVFFDDRTLLSTYVEEQDTD